MDVWIVEFFEKDSEFKLQNSFVFNDKLILLVHICQEWFG